MYHLGCGEMRLAGYVNVDVRDTSAADITADLNRLDLPRRARGIFSHAFFEHLMRDARLPHLRAARKLLCRDGFVCYLGLPDFRAIAEQYVRRGEGITEPIFGLHDVYRYTHGDPEHVDGWYFEQLHKSLFDTQEAVRLLSRAGFAAFVVFNYLYPAERVAVTMGFYAVARPRSVAQLQEDCLAFLHPFAGVFVESGSVRFSAGHSGTATAARIASASVEYRRLASRLASRLRARV
jgi:predicted SAM-dependent methyltransferase